ncbi:MAG: molybdate ABC transporter permease subunit [Alphaproteobacteria bacterium]|nr:MAG: molybdate ABC transporter permease subunit [Alphaproteobacteria bacterium]
MSELEIAALLLSLKVASVAVAASLPLGLAVAWLLAKREFRGRLLLDFVVHLPTVVPPVVVGYGLLILFSPASPLGLPIAFSWYAAALAAAVMAFPFLVRGIRGAMEAVDPRLEAMARSLGAGEWRVFWRVTVPLSQRGLVSGLVLAFARALAEFGATIAFAANIPRVTQTLPLAVFSALQSPGGEAAAARLSLVAVGLAGIALLLAEWVRPGKKARR